MASKWWGSKATEKSHEAFSLWPMGVTREWLGHTNTSVLTRRIMNSPCSFPRATSPRYLVVPLFVKMGKYLYIVASAPKCSGLTSIYLCSASLNCRPLTGRPHLRQHLTHFSALIIKPHSLFLVPLYQSKFIVNVVLLQGYVGWDISVVIYILKTLHVLFI